MPASYSEAVIQSRFKDCNGNWTQWREIPAGPGTLQSERTRIKALRERQARHQFADQEQFRLVLRDCVVIDYDLATGEPVGETLGG